ncbi:MAG: hypothetical protein ACE5I2_12485, partial [Anaerolineae bacterium]
MTTSSCRSVRPFYKLKPEKPEEVANNFTPLGPAFIKVCTYAPYAVKLCLNGHEWAKRQLRKRGIAFEALDNGFLSCEDPDALQAVCDQLGPDQIQAFF